MDGFRQDVQKIKTVAYSFNDLTILIPSSIKETPFVTQNPLRLSEINRATYMPITR